MQPWTIDELVRSAIAVMVVVGFLCVLTWSIIFGLPDTSGGDQGMYLLIGALNTALGMVMQTYFRQRDIRVEERNSD